MRTRFLFVTRRRFLILESIALVMAIATFIACGGSGGGTPTAPTPQTVQVAGVWSVTATTTGVTGGECLASVFQLLVGGVDRGTMQIQQNGSSLTATFTTDSTGASCSYQGTAGSSSLALNIVSCTASDLIGATCPGTSIRRDVRLQTGGINATVAGGSATGTSAQSYNVVVAGSSSPVGTLVLNGSFSATKR